MFGNVDVKQSRGTPAANQAAPASRPPGRLARLREDVLCVFQRDPAARPAREVLTTYPGVHAVFLQRISHRLWRSQWRYPARLLSFLARMLTQIDIHPGARIGRRLFIDHGSGVVIGETAVIGDDVTLYHGVTLGGTSWHAGKRHPTLQDGVVVGASAKILGPITIGERTRIGANSVVIDDVPAQMTVVGVPGRTVVPGRRAAAHERLDLNHHDLPDPVERNLSALVARMTVLEEKLAKVTARLAAWERDGEHCVTGAGRAVVTIK